MSDPLTPTSRDANAALVLGILGLASCGLFSPFAIYFGSRALHEIELGGGDSNYGGARTARLGQLLGIIGTTMLVLVVVFGSMGVIGLRHILENR